MGKTKAGSVKQHGFHPECIFKKAVLLVAAVGPVANYGMQYVGKMPAYLMHTAGGGFYLYQRIA